MAEMLIFQVNYNDCAWYDICIAWFLDIIDY